MQADSFYRARSPAPPARAPLAGRHEVHTCIVGGGFAGLNTALGLAERGSQDVMLLEARDIGHGASGRNGGFVFGGFSRGEDALLDGRQRGEAAAHQRRPQRVGDRRERRRGADLGAQAVTGFFNVKTRTASTPSVTPVSGRTKLTGSPTMRPVTRWP